MPIDTDELSTRELLVKIATRQEQIREEILRLRSTVAELRHAVDAAATSHVTKTDFEKLESRVDAMIEKFVTQEQFQPIKNFVYGMVTVILLAVLGAIISLILV